MTQSFKSIIMTFGLALSAACSAGGEVGGISRLDGAEVLNAAAQSSGAVADSGDASTQSTHGDANSGENASPGSSGLQQPLSYITATTSGLLTLKADTGLCVGVTGGDHSVGTPLSLSSCDSGANQQFALLGNYIIAYGTHCVKPSTPNVQAPLQIDRCDTDKTQLFAMATNGSIHWLQDTTLCLGIDTAAGQSNAPVRLVACDANQIGQTFEIADASAALLTLNEVVIPFTHEPASGYGVKYVDPPSSSQLWPSRGSLDWSRYVKQGATGDCTFMSGMGAIAQHHHELLRPLIRQIAPHRYQVGFYYAGMNYSSAPKLLVWVEVDDKLPINPDGTSWYAANPVPDSVNQNAVLFAALLEKGYALYLEKYQLAGFPSNATPQGYAGTVGNSPGVAMSLTGRLTYDTDTTGFSKANAWTYLNMVSGGYPVTSYKAQETADGLPGGHVYYVLNAWTDASGTQMVMLRNPWGQDNSSSHVKLAGSSVGTFSMPLSTFMNEFNEVCTVLLAHP